jgi:Tat protein translocase TatB subunit
VGPEKILVILVIALILLGPKELPEAARKIGNIVREFRRLSDGFQAQLRSGLETLTAEPSETPLNTEGPTDPPPASTDAAA